MLSAMALALNGCKEKTEEINLIDYVKADVTGFNEHASISLSMDSDKIEDKCRKVKKEKSAIDAVLLKEMLESVEIECDDTANDHKNGDKIEVKFKWDDDNKEDCSYTMKSKKGTYKVKDLEEAEEVDPFEGLNVTFEGIGPNGQADVDTSGCDEFVRENGYFSVDGNTYGLSNGDTVKVVYSYYENDFFEEKKLVTVEEKDFTVEGLGEYPASLALTDVTTLNSTLETEVKAKIAEFNNYDWSSYEVITETLAEYEFTTAVSYLQGFYGYSQEYMSANEYYAVYKVDVTAKVTDKGYSELKKGTTLTKTVYFIAQTGMIYKEADGTLVAEELTDWWTSTTYYMDGILVVSDPLQIQTTIQGNSYYSDYTVTQVQ